VFDAEAFRQLREMSKQLERDMAIAKPQLDAATAAMRSINDGAVGHALRQMNDGAVAQAVRDFNRYRF
jgi:hypothetical protein